MLAIFLDIETTGLDSSKHSVIDIGFKVVNITTGELIHVYSSIVKPLPSGWENRDPISMEVNGYTFERVSQGRDPEVVGKEIIQLLTSLRIERGKAVFICQNPAFDRGFFKQLVDVYTQERLNWPYHWLDLASMYWVVVAQKMTMQGLPFPEQMSLSKNDIAREYNLPSEHEPHQALNGVDHLILCYQAVLEVNFSF